MARKLVWVMVVMSLATPVWAGGPPGTISGTVRNSSGTEQMGAMVEVFAGSPIPIATVFTDAKGFFAAVSLDPGTYHVKVSAPSFLPALREDLGLKSGANLIVNVTLNTLFEAMQMLPARRRTVQDEDDWKWTLRSVANRPILRVLDDGPLVVVSKGDESDKVLKARVAFLAGSEGGGFGTSPDMTTSFNVERSLFTAGTLALRGNVGYGPGAAPGTVLRTSYSHRLASGSEPQVSFTLRRFATPDMAAHDAALQALALSLSDNISVADILDLSFGSEYQTIAFMGHVSAFRPFASADLHLSPDTVLEYRYATSVPDTRGTKGFDSAPADLSESGPRVSLVNSNPVIESARHHEVSLSRRVGKNNFQVAAYRDRVSDPALTGVGDVSLESGEFLPDFYAGTFTWSGPNLETTGLRALAQRKLNSDLTATLDYSYGGVLAPGIHGADWANLRSSLATERRHSLTYKMAGSIPVTHTRWIASYRWTSGGYALTPVDMFNVSPGQADPYLSFFVRQPLPGMGFMPGHMEALVDVRNLLAQGYFPVLGNGGRTLYLVQSARAFRGGVAFTF
jgi:hypothetical protein